MVHCQFPAATEFANWPPRGCPVNGYIMGETDGPAWCAIGLLGDSCLRRTVRSRIAKRVSRHSIAWVNCLFLSIHVCLRHKSRKAGYTESDPRDTILLKNGIAFFSSKFCILLSERNRRAMYAYALLHTTN